MFVIRCSTESFGCIYCCPGEPYNTIDPMDGRALANDRMKSQAPRLFWIALFWLGIGLFDATQTVFAMRAEGMHHNWTALFATSLLSWIPWAIATPLVLRLQRRHPASQWKEASFWLRHVLKLNFTYCGSRSSLISYSTL
jgi:hypothetical protein